MLCGLFREQYLAFHLPSQYSAPVLFIEGPRLMEVMEEFMFQLSQGCRWIGCRKAELLDGGSSYSWQHQNYVFIYIRYFWLFELMCPFSFFPSGYITSRKNIVILVFLLCYPNNLQLWIAYQILWVLSKFLRVIRYFHIYGREFKIFLKFTYSKFHLFSDVQFHEFQHIYRLI